MQTNNIKILVVEDNIVNQTVAKDMLNHLGLDITIAENGQQAVEQISNNQYDLVFMDCQMPIMNGYDATREIRKHEQQQQKSRTPIIALTAHAMQGDEQRCLAAGMDDHMSKPFTFDELDEILNKWLPNMSISDKPAMTEANEPTENILNEQVLDQYKKISQPRNNLVEKLFTLYTNDCEKLINTLLEGIRNNDLDAIKATAHMLKSSSANIGATAIADYFELLEQIDNNLSDKQKDDIIGKVQHEYQLVCSEIKNYPM